MCDHTAKGSIDLNDESMNDIRQILQGCAPELGILCSVFSGGNRRWKDGCGGRSE